MTHSSHDHSPCCGCHLSRRNFLSTVGAAAVAGPLLSLPRSYAAELDWNSQLDIASFRPAPKINIMGCVIRHETPYWLGWPGTSYDVEGKRKEYSASFVQSAERVGAQYSELEAPLDSDEATEAFANQVAARKPDAVLVHMQHIYHWKRAHRIAEAGVPTIVFAPIGMVFTGEVRDFSRQPGVHVISSLETSAVEQAFRMIRAKRQMEMTKLMIVAGDKRATRTWDKMGTTLQWIPRSNLHELFAEAPETEEMRDLASRMRRRARKTIEPDRQDLRNATRSYVTAKQLLHREGCNALTTDCLGMVSTKVVPTPPCMAASMFQDAGVTYGCEADRNAAMSLLLVSYLFDKPGFMNDPVPETVKNHLVAAHCTCGTRLNGFDQKHEPYVLRSHSESDIGVAMQVLWKEGQPVTLALFQGPDKLLVDTGTVVANVNTPPAGGCRTSFEIEMDKVEDVRDVRGFHQVVFYGNHRRDLQEFARMNGVEVIHSPEHPPEPEAEETATS